MAETNEPKKFKYKFRFSDLFPVKVSLGEQTLLAKHLSMMLKSGVSEVESLQIIRDQIKSKRFRKLLTLIIADVENGQFLSEAIKRYKETFGELFVSLVKLGEVSGTLPENLDYLSEEIRKKSELKGKVRSAMVYPVIILITMLLITSGLLIFVFPKILPILVALNVPLPITTRILITISNFTSSYWPELLVGLVILIILWSVLIRTTIFKYILHRILLSTPIAGKIVRDYNMANIARTMALLLKSGVKIVEAVASTANSVSNLVIKDAFMEAAEEIKRGGTIYKAIERKQGLFPTTFSRMVQIGERTGNLDANLFYLATFYENEVSEKLRDLSATIEPILMILMGLMVGFIALSIITPIYQLARGI